MIQSKAPTKARIHLFDFDHTIYKGDASLDFYFFCLGKNPAIILYLPYQLWHGLGFLLSLESRTIFKSRFFAYLQRTKATKQFVEEFWERKYSKIQPWYFAHRSTRDVIISASPEFLLEPVALRLGIYKLIATRMSPATGVISGENCYGAEKVNRLKSELGSNIVVAKAYSDSLKDLPILEMAKEAYFVKGGRVTKLSVK